jgi:hypothetical protein
MDNKLRSDLYDKLKESLHKSAVEELFFKTLTPSIRNEMPDGSNLPAKLMWFIEAIERLGKEEEMWAVLKEIQPNIVNSLDITVPDPVEPERPPYSDGFFNRKKEWEEIVVHPENDELDALYYLFDAPAGYGKTALMDKIRQEFQRRGWLQASVCLEKGAQLPHFANKLANQLGLDPAKDLRYFDDPQRMGIEFGGIIAHQLADKKGFALLLDIDKRTDETVLSTLEKILKGFIPVLYESLEFNHRSCVPLNYKNYRVVIAGRYLATKVSYFREEIEPIFNRRELSPFNYKVTRDLCDHHFKEKHETYPKDDNYQEKLGEFAAHLLFYSGGHPGCMLKILEQFDESDNPPHLFFEDESNIDKINRDIMSPEADYVLKSLPSEWFTAFEIFCIYRFLSADLLKRLLDEKLIFRGLANHADDLMSKLKLSCLMDWGDKANRWYLRDGIVRRVLAVGRRIKIGSEEFKCECDRARRLCKECLEEFDDNRASWVIEMLFQHLHAHANEINDREKRRVLRKQFIDEILPDTLDNMTNGSSHSSIYHLEMLQGKIENDDEFSFTVNYYLRDERYNGIPFQELKKNLEQYLGCANE